MSQPQDPLKVLDYLEQVNTLVGLRERTYPWVALIMMARKRNAPDSGTVAMIHLREILTELMETDPGLLFSFLASEIAAGIAQYAAVEWEDDLPAALGSIFGPTAMRYLDQFLDSEGASCPACGYPDILTQHSCPEVRGDDEQS